MEDYESMRECPFRVMAGHRDTSCAGGRCAWWVPAHGDGNYSACATRKVADMLTNVSYYQRIMADLR